MYVSRCNLVIAAVGAFIKVPSTAHGLATADGRVDPVDVLGGLDVLGDVNADGHRAHGDGPNRRDGRADGARAARVAAPQPRAPECLLMVQRDADRDHAERDSLRTERGGAVSTLAQREDGRGQRSDVRSAARSSPKP